MGLGVGWEGGGLFVNKEEFHVYAVYKNICVHHAGRLMSETTNRYPSIIHTACTHILSRHINDTPLWISIGVAVGVDPMVL